MTTQSKQAGIICTPGFWHVKSENDYVPAQVWSEDGRLLADVYGETRKARAGNAALMAAATEMYGLLAKIADAGLDNAAQRANLIADVDRLLGTIEQAGI